MPFKDSKYRHARSESLDDIIVETESSIEFVTDPKVDDLMILLELTTEVLNIHVHDNLKSSTLIVLLLIYCSNTVRKSDDIYAK